MSLVLIDWIVTEGFRSVGHDGEGAMVDNVHMVAMPRRHNIMTRLINAAVTVNVWWAGELT
jgi:hypothetical protein